MTQQIINVGAAPNDGTGDPARTAFSKSNDNFTELYARGSVTDPQGRLTLQPSVPVMTTTQSARVPIYYTPYAGDQIPIYNGTSMVMTTFAELNMSTLNTANNPAAVGASQVLDWFVWSDAGTLRLCHGPAWSSDTARSAGTALLMVNGIWLNNASITNACAAQRGTYVGTTRSNASSTLDWIYGTAGNPPTAALFGVWNCYNRKVIATTVADTAASWTVPTATVRSYHSITNNRVSWVSGLAEDAAQGTAHSIAGPFTGGQPHGISVSLDTTSAINGIQGGVWGTNTVPIVASNVSVVLGFHFYQLVEANGDNATITFYGAANATYSQGGMNFTFLM